MRKLYSKLYRYGMRPVARRTDDPGAGSEGSNTGGNGGGGGGKKEVSVSQVVSRLINRYGDANTALGVLAGENLDYRRRHRADQERITSLQGQGPKDGGMVLTPEQAADFKAYQALGKPDEVKQKVERVGTLEEQVAGAARDQLLATAAGAVAPGTAWKANVLKDIVQAKGLHVEMKDVTEKDKAGNEVTVKRPHVRPANDDKAALTPLEGWVKQNAADYLPALAATAGGNTGNTNGNTNTTGNAGVGFHGGSRSGGQGQATDLVSQRLNRINSQASKGNPLAPAPDTSAAK